MKITKYFIGQRQYPHEFKQAVKEALDERDEFFKENNNLIDEIEREELKLLSAQSHVIVVIELCYYPKNNI